MTSQPPMSQPNPPNFDNARLNPPWLLRGVVLMFGLLALLIGYSLFLLGPTGRTAEVQIERGKSASRVGEVLERAGLVRSAKLFAMYLRFSGRDKYLRPGIYRLTGRGVRVLAQDISGKAKPVSVKITFPEGWRLSQIAERLSENGFDGQAFLKLATSRNSFWPGYAKGDSLEGFLFPATYTFAADLPPEDILRVMTTRLEQEFSPETKSLLGKLKLSIQEWITLASIVQVEAANAAEMPEIAGVFLNRLEAGMPLQSDPTVAYALGKDLPKLDRAAGDFEADSPYNSYRVRGLPPGAISNPGADALQAVLQPKRTDEKGRKYLYFFHSNGRIFLNVDFEGHQRDLARYR